MYWRGRILYLRSIKVSIRARLRCMPTGSESTGHVCDCASYGAHNCTRSISDSDMTVAVTVAGDSYALVSLPVSAVLFAARTVFRKNARRIRRLLFRQRQPAVLPKSAHTESDHTGASATKEPCRPGLADSPQYATHDGDTDEIERLSG